MIFLELEECREEFRQGDTRERRGVPVGGTNTINTNTSSSSNINRVIARHSRRRDWYGFPAAVEHNYLSVPGGGLRVVPVPVEQPDCRYLQNST